MSVPQGPETVPPVLAAAARAAVYRHRQAAGSAAHRHCASSQPGRPRRGSLPRPRVGPVGPHALAECFGFGRLDISTFTPLSIPSLEATVLSGSDFGGIGVW
jgi:hypothetical protein